MEVSDILIAVYVFIAIPAAWVSVAVYSMMFREARSMLRRWRKGSTNGR